MSTATHDHPLLDSLSLTTLAAARTVVSGEWNDRAVHRDPHARLYVVMGGVGRITVAGSRYLLRQGTLAMIPSDTPVVLHRSPGLDHYWIHFTARVAAGLSLFSVFAAPVVLGPVLSSAPARAQSIVERGVTDAIGRFAATTRLRLLLEPFIDGGRWSDATERLARFSPALRYINEHLCDPVRIADVAATVNLHPTYFANQFADVVGVAPRDYIRAQRIEAAQMMLLHTEMPIKSIARDAGFRDSAYFCRAFRAVTGVTPGRYRERGMV